jgi:ferredoxin--NADP+ reductase
LVGDEEGRVQRMRLVKNELCRTEAGTLRPQTTDQYEEIPVGLVFHAIGYHGVPLPGIPFNRRWGTINNHKGRVIDEDETPLPGLFAVGWIKRGPSGVIGTNKPDAVETVKAMLEDLDAGIHLNPPEADSYKAHQMVRHNQPRYVFFQDWLRLDQIEIERGEAQNRPRIKFSEVEKMLNSIDI